jgi:membrane-associated protease RseP (regulator of RpoE activity)
VAKQHVRRTDNAVEILGTQGQVLQSIPIPQPPEHPPVMLGVRFEDPGEALVKHLGAEVNGCALVVSVMPNGPGYRAGIEDFDIITAVNGKSPATAAAIRSALQRMSPGQSITLTVRRGKVSRDFAIETVAWKHIPLPAEMQPEPMRPVPSPKIPGTPNMPADTNERGRPAAAPQRTAAGG